MLAQRVTGVSDEPLRRNLRESKRLLLSRARLTPDERPHLQVAGTGQNGMYEAAYHWQQPLQLIQNRAPSDLREDT